MIINSMGISLDIVLYAGLALIGGAILVFTRQFLANQEAAASDELLNLGNANKEPVSKSIIIRLAKPLFKIYIVPVVARMKIDPWRAKIRQKLIAAGVKAKFSEDEFLALKISAIFGTPIGYYFYTYALEENPAIVYGLLAGVLGFFLPDIWLAGERKKRVIAIQGQLPFVIDMLALITEAGSDINGAMVKIIDRCKPSPLIDELKQVQADIRVGENRADALRKMADRIELVELSSLVSILNTAEAMGATVAGVLKQQSEQLRLERMVRAEKAAATIPTKLQLVTLVAVVAVMIVMIGPFVMPFLSGDVVAF